MSTPRIDKAHYRSGPGIRMLWPLSRQRRLWKAAHLHVAGYQESCFIRGMLAMFDMKVGETRDGMTLLARVGGDEP